jgi:hypothetical protein
MRIENYLESFLSKNSYPRAVVVPALDFVWGVAISYHH